jgi:hypothetical protein
MATVERGVPLVERIIRQVKPHLKTRGAKPGELDALESRLMVEIPPTLRRYLEFDYTFRSFGPQWLGRHRFGREPQVPSPKRTSVRKLAEAMTELGWTTAPIRTRVIRLPNLPGDPWNCLYLGESRRDGELPILSLVNDETNVHVFIRYTSFDLYLAEQSGLVDLSESMRLDDLESHLSNNRELLALLPGEEYSGGDSY